MVGHCESPSLSLCNGILVYSGRLSKLWKLPRNSYINEHALRISFSRCESEPLLNFLPPLKEEAIKMSDNLFGTTADASYSSTASSSFSASDIDNINQAGSKRSGSLGFRIRDHVKLGSKLSETVKGKLRLGATIIQKGGRKNMFKQIFAIKEGEELLKASQCYLSTTAGPIPGQLFVSTLKVAFCSETNIVLPLPSGEFHRTPYRVVIPIAKIRRACESENEKEAAQKYIQIVTEDGCEFWFMGFLRYEKALLNLQKAISMASPAGLEQH